MKRSRAAEITGLVLFLAFCLGIGALDAAVTASSVKTWYADLNKPPIGDRKMRWPGREPYVGGWHDFWPTYREFWDRAGDHGGDVPEPAPVDEFLSRMRRDAPEKLNVRVR